MTDKEPLKITIVTPSYNQAHFLRETLESIHSQGYSNIEHIVIDGGSTDGSVEILREYEDRLAYWVSEPDEGQTAALIKGFERATGDILCWLNSDDLYEAYTLKLVAQYFADNPNSRFVYGDAKWINPDGSLIYERKEMRFVKWIWLYAYNYIPQPSSFWRRDLYLDVNGLDRNFSLSMDGDLFARFSRIAHMDHLPITLSRFRFYPDQRNQKLRNESLKEDRVIVLRELGRMPSEIEFKLVGSFARIIRYSIRKISNGLKNL